MFGADTEAIFHDPRAEVVAAEKLAATWRVISAYKT